MAALINPPAERLGASNAILWGRGRCEYHVREFPGPLSIKSLISGAAEWRVGRSRFEVDANSYLLLNHDQRYSMTIESKAPIGFYERLRFTDSHISPVLASMREQVEAGGDRLNEMFMRLALGLVSLRSELPGEIGRLPAVRSSTRQELLKRVHAGKRIIDEMFAGPITLAVIARAACLSPFHFHSLFKAVFRETPHDYMVRRRLEKAARLLRETDEPVTDICLETGFCSLGSFSALFRARFGAPPREFRRAKKQESRSIQRRNGPG